MLLLWAVVFMLALGVGLLHVSPGGTWAEVVGRALQLLSMGIAGAWIGAHFGVLVRSLIF